MREKKEDVFSFFLCVGSTKKIIQWIKNMSRFKIFCTLDKNQYESHTFEKKEVIFLWEKN